MQSLFARATSLELVEWTLPSGASVTIRELCIRFGRASPDRLRPGTLPATYTAKPLVTFNGSAMFGELAVVRWLETDGWEAVWLDTRHGRKVWRDMPTRSVPVTLPPARQALYDAIVSLNGGHATGSFDVMAWRGTHVIFMDYREPGDEPTQGKLRWMDAAIAAGVSPNDLLVAQAEE